ncbi:MAG: homoserine O-acetyltransferase [Solitalea sp.]
MIAAKIFSGEKFELESGSILPGLEIAYHTWGDFRPEKNNVIWVCHALTANSNVPEWWPGLFGEDCYFNPRDHFIVCANILGSCYGSTGPLSANPETEKPYYGSFPTVTVRDMIKAHQLLAKHLGITKIHTILGGSLGGQQAMEWAITEPDRIDHAILIATNAVHSPWGIAFNESQRMALTADETFGLPSPDAGAKGLKAARAIAMLSYRNYKTYELTQTDEDRSRLENYRACSYQQYQGQKLVNRFNAYSYWTLSRAMDTHDVARNRGSLERALGGITARTLVIGISSDVLFPITEQQLLARLIPGAHFVEIDSVYGHDGFLIETALLAEHIGAFLNKTAKKFEFQQG